MTSGILSPTHLLIVLVVALIVLGPKRLPAAGRALGQGLREFKDSISGGPHEPEPAQIPAPVDALGRPHVSLPEISPEAAPVAVGVGVAAGKRS